VEAQAPVVLPVIEVHVHLHGHALSLAVCHPFQFETPDMGLIS
jgi:hypothetical protein